MKKTSVTRVLLAGNDREDVRRGVCDYARKAGWIIITGSAPQMPPRTTADFWNVSGIIADLVTGSRETWVKPCLPVVSLSQASSLRVWADHREVGRLAARHFLDERFTNLAYVFVSWTPWIMGQREGFEQAARRAGARMHLLDWTANHQGKGFLWQVYRRWVGRRLAELPKPIGVLLDSDWMAIETLDACLEAGLAVPEEVALVGVGDNVSICEATPVPLSSVRLDGYQEGYQAAGLLDARMSGRIRRRELLIAPTGLTVRQSSNIVAVPHLPTARALRYIWDHMAERGLSPQTVAAFVGLSHKTLKRHFLEHLGASVAQEIAVARLTRAEMLLAGTRKTVIQAAQEAGFTSHVHLRRTFRRLRGRPLQEWRKEMARR